MSQCVPSWDNLDDVTPSSRLPLRSRSNSNIAPDVPLLDYEVAELTWENGQIAMHGLGPPRVPNNKPMMSQNNNNSTTATHACKYAPPQWDKPRAGGTLESIVNQATRPSLPRKPPGPFGGSEELVPWFDRNAAAAAAAAAANNNNSNTNNNMDAQVPCAGGGGMGTYTQVASCSGAATQEEAGGVLGKRVRTAAAGAAAARVPVSGPEWSGPAASVSGTSATFGSHQMRVESCERDHFGVSMGSPENASSGKPSTKATAADDHDSVCHSRLQRESGDEEDEDDKKKGKSSSSTKRSRAAAIHNQSERKRRDKINQRMKTLQKLVPNSSKTDKASMLDEVIDYLKQLQAQVQMMSRMNMPAMMLPVAMQQQLQLSMMSSMGMGMGMGMGMQGMDINNMARPNLATMPQVLHPNPFMQMTSWDGAAAAAAAAAAVQPQLAAVLQDPLSSFFACQSQPMTAEAYSRMAATYQQLHQPPASSSKS